MNAGDTDRNLHDPCLSVFIRGSLLPNDCWVRVARILQSNDSILGIAMSRRKSLPFRGVLSLALVLPCLGYAADWQPAKGPLMTRWAKDVSPEKVHPEYPRPQMVREKWTNLNGLWDFSVRPAAEMQPD